jgi:hypothetical protein
MRVLMHPNAHNCTDNPAAHWRMVVDGHGVPIDLDHVRNSIVDPGSLTGPEVARVEWGPRVEGGEMREAGVITRRDGQRVPFFDRKLLAPYLALYARRRGELGTAD